MGIALNLKLSLGVIPLASLSVYGCSIISPSVENQCQSLYQASKEFKNYKNEADTINSDVIHKYAPGLKSLGNQTSLANTHNTSLAVYEAIEKNKSNIHADQSIAHKEFSSKMTKHNDDIKTIRITDKKLKDLQKIFSSFYDVRSRYHNLQAKLFKNMADTNYSSERLTGKMKVLNKEINGLQDIIESPSSKSRYYKSFIALRKYCNITEPKS